MHASSHLAAHSRNAVQQSNNAGRQQQAPANNHYPVSPLAGRKRHREVIEIEDGDDGIESHTNKKHQNDAGYARSQRLQNQSFHKGKGSTGPGFTNASKGPTITLPIGNVSQATAESVLPKVIAMLQVGGSMMPVPPNMDGLIVPKDSQILLRNPGKNIAHYRQANPGE